MPFDRNISDTSIPMNIKDNGKIIKKYSSRKLKTIDNENQKYRNYLTKSKPILDEANYVASRRKDKKTSKKEEDFNFIQDLKNKREQVNKNKNKQVEPSLIDFGDTNNITDVLNNLFPNQDITPTIQSDLELANLVKRPKEEVLDRQEILQDLFGVIAPPKIKPEVEEEKAVKIENAILGKVKRNRAKKEVENLKKQNDINKAFEEARKEVEASNKIGGAILGKVKRNRAKKEVEGLMKQKEEVQKEEVQKEEVPLKRVYRKKKEQSDILNLTPLKRVYKTKKEQSGPPLGPSGPSGPNETAKRGRPKGSINKKK
jgi:hypothetical protein